MINGGIYANATSMAGAFDNGSQKLKDWKRSPKTIELIDELNKINGVENSHSLIVSGRVIYKLLKANGYETSN